MTKTILVAYATRAGSTREVAETIGEELRQAELQVDVCPIKEVSNLSSYQAVIIGSAIRAGSWLPEAKRFVKKNQAYLKTVPVAYFLVCMTLMNDTPENRASVAKYLEPMRQLVPPIAEGDFAGKMDYSKLGIFARFIAKSLVKVPEGDYRNFDLIRQWARTVGAQIKSSAAN